MPKPKRRNRTRPPTPEAPGIPPVVAPTATAHDNGDAPTIGAVSVAPSSVGLDLPERVIAPPTLRSIAGGVTLEAGAYALILCAALLIRLIHLDARPLAPAEAQTAAAAWEFLNQRAVGEFSSPFLFTLNWLSFLLFGAFDLTARFFPAALGAFLVLIPSLARRAIGQTGALAAAVLIAISPTLVFFARTDAAADLAVGGAFATLLLFWNYHQSENRRTLYAAAMLAALALTADTTAFTILAAGAVLLGIIKVLDRREVTGAPAPTIAEQAPLLKNPLVRAGIVFAVVYVLSATTFLLSRDGLGISFNLLATWLGGLSTIGPLTSPLNLLLVYEPIPLVFGLAGIVLALSLRGEQARSLRLMRLIALIALFALGWYSLAGDKTPAFVTAMVLPLILAAGWFIGTLFERAVEDIGISGGWRSTLTGELPVLLLLLLLSVLIYQQVAIFLAQSRFSATLDSISRALGGNSETVTLTFAALALALISLLLFGVFIGLSVLLIGVARTSSLVAVAILIVLAMATLRGMWLASFWEDQPVRELLATAQTPTQLRDLLDDLKFNSQWQYGDPHVIRVAADPQLGAVGQWYLRDFPNVSWTAQPNLLSGAEAVITDAASPPPGNWRGARYRRGVTWQPSNLSGVELWRWLMFRVGGGETWQTTMLWFPTEN